MPLVSDYTIRKRDRRGLLARMTAGLLFSAAAAAHSQEQVPEQAEASTPESSAAEEAAPAEAAPTPEAVPVETIPVTEPAAPETAAEDAPVQLDDVVVTVTKRAQATRDIPSSMTVLGGEKLEQLGLRKLKDFFTLVPGINMQDEIGGIQRKLSVRGAGPDTGTNQTVGSVMGDIPISDPYGATTIVDPNPWDMSTVEVLKGPQGTLFGATSLAGLIRYVPNYPELGVWQGKAFFDYTTIELGGAAPTYGAAFNAPVGDDIALRASGVYQHLPGVLDSDNPARQEEDFDKGQSWNGRAMALWQPLNRLTINAWYMKERRTADDLNLTTLPEGTYIRNDAPTASPVANGYSLATLDLRYEFDWATLVSLSGYQRKNSFNDVDTSYLVQPLARSGVSWLRADRTVQTKGLLQELRLISPDDGALTWLGGAYYSTYSADILTRLFAFGVPGATSGFNPLAADEQAIYGEGNYDFTDRFRLTLGSRFYRTKVDGTLRASGATSTNDGKEPGTTEKGWSPKAAVTYRPWTDVMLYGTVARGFQFGGFNLPTIPYPDTPLTFKSSALWNYETGVRTDWLDRTLRLDLTAFFIDWKNPQVRQSGENRPSSLYVANVGRSNNIGAELTFRWLTPIPGLTFEQVGSYIEARTKVPFKDASSGKEIPPGTLMPSAPLVQAVTTLSYSLPLGPWMTQALLINSLQDEAWADITHRTRVGGFKLLSATLNVTRNDLSWLPALTLSVNNITNVQKLVAGFGPAPGVTGASRDAVADSSYVYTQPRSIVMRASFEF